MIKTVIALTVILLITGGIYYFLNKFSIKNITVEGSSHYTREEIIDMVIQEPLDRISLVLSMKYHNRQITDIAFIQSIEVNVVSADTIHIQVYEKALAGYIEYLGQYMYFDKDGIVVEASSRVTAGIPEITGLKFDSVIVHNVLPVGNEKVFSEVLEITNLLGKYDLEVEKIHFNKKMQITLYMGDVRVSIGEADKLSEKVMKLRDLTPHLKDLSGVLHLENYSSSADTVIFTKDAEK
jgi:cell division protein FtsQ